MKKTQSRSLVIDASVARAAGGDDAIHPTAMHARNFLSAVLTICHKAVMTPAVRTEWDAHQSRFARKWRSSMVARKKLLLFDINERDDIRAQVNLATISQKQKAAMLKDCHLVESAIASDNRIISLDNVARDLFKNSLDVPDVNSVLWVNPTDNAESVLVWLEKGALVRKEYKLT